MSVLTEMFLRQELKDKKINKYFVEPDVKVTPAAEQFLKERGVELVIKNHGKDKNLNIENKNPEIDNKNKDFTPRFISIPGGGSYFDTKPESMTQLYGNKLVYKNHPKIILRGKLDNLESKILEVQVTISKLGIDKLVEDLEEILQFCRKLMRAEVLKEPIEEIYLIGLTEKEVRDMSHFPKKYFNIEHITPTWEMGDAIVLLNSIRSMVREVEIAAVNAFKIEEGLEREDILKAYNRLSSYLYVMMLRYKSGYYSKGRNI